MQPTEVELPSKTGEGEDKRRQEEEAEEEKTASLASLPVMAPYADLCMSFWYHMSGDRVGSLHIKQRRETEQEEEEGGRLLWTVSGHQDNRWREGRVLLPHSSVSYQVIMIDRSNNTHRLWLFVRLSLKQMLTLFRLFSEDFFIFYKSDYPHTNCGSLCKLYVL